MEHRQFPVMLNIHIPYKPTVPFLGIYPRGIKSSVHTKTYSNFIHSIKGCRQPWRPSTRRWMNTLPSVLWNAAG